MQFSLETITIYPIKSCAGIALQEARMEERGLQPRSGGRVLVRVWSSLCLAMLVSLEADAWICDFLGAALRLVYMPDETRRAINPAYSISRSLVSFADGYPCLLVGASSLADLN